MSDKWRCSACGFLNSMEHDNYCYRCMARALKEDEINHLVALDGSQTMTEHEHFWSGQCRFCSARFFTATEMEKHERECASKAIPGKLEWFEGKLCEVKNPRRLGWWRFHEHYDRDGYCDNPARGY